MDFWEDVPFSNETALQQAVSQRPVIVAICCGDDISAWHHYTSGVFDVPCCTNRLVLDHGMVVVGYGVEKGMEYWKLKNSWGEHWGEKVGVCGGENEALKSGTVCHLLFLCCTSLAMLLHHHCLPRLVCHSGKCHSGKSWSALAGLRKD